jgi:phosphoribosyl 1,2-cyclic phosphodiesterase
VRFASLGSGSKGNCLVAEAGGSRVIIDCGLSPRETSRRLARLGLAPADLDAVLVTHEHADHVGHAYPFAAQHALPVYLTHGTRRAQEDGGAAADGVTLRPIEGQQAFAVGALRVEPFTVPHDAREPVHPRGTPADYRQRLDRAVIRLQHRRLAVASDRAR